MWAGRKGPFFTFPPQPSCSPRSTETKTHPFPPLSPQSPRREQLPAPLNKHLPRQAGELGQAPPVPLTHPPHSPMLGCFSRRQMRASRSSFWWSETQMPR